MTGVLGLSLLVIQKEAAFCNKPVSCGSYFTRPATTPVASFFFNLPPPLLQKLSCVKWKGELNWWSSLPLLSQLMRNRYLQYIYGLAPRACVTHSIDRFSLEHKKVLWDLVLWHCLVLTVHPFVTHRLRSRAIKLGLIRFFFHSKQCFSLINSSWIPLSAIVERYL